MSVKSAENWPQWPYFDQEMTAAVTRVLESGKVNYWTGVVHELENGTKVRGECGLFETEFARYHNVSYAIALANGTVALELALAAFNVGFGDEVITTSRTFIASASAAWMRGAKPVFADIEIESQNISAKTIESLITSKTKAVIAVHLAGWSCEMDELKSLLQEKSKQYGHKIYLVEDCAQCLGGEYKGEKLGSIGDGGCFSFCQDKIITTGGEGGMLILKDPKAYRRAWSFKDHGKDFNRYNSALGHPLVEELAPTKSSYYSSLGTNWRMTEMQAAIGRIALRSLDNWNIAKRRKNANVLFDGFRSIKGLRVYEPPEYIYHSYYKFYAFLDLEKLETAWSRERIIKEVSALGIMCQFGSTWNIGQEDGWQAVQIADGSIMNFQQESVLINDLFVGERALMFQVHPTLDEKHMFATLEAVKEVMSRALRDGIN